MLRELALPVALTAVLAAAGCAAAGIERATTAPSTVETPTAGPSASSGPSDAAGTAAPTAPNPPPAGLLGTATPAAGDPGAPGLPEGSGASIDDVLRLGAVATWVERPSLIALSLPASGSCWASVGDPVAESTTRIAVEVDRPASCDAPDDARTYAIAVPPGIDASAELQLAVVGLEHEFTLALPER